jgi:trans-aconitate methyltransferase
MQNIATDLFSKWAENGKDRGMAQSHSPAVNQILDKTLSETKSNFNFADAGCGNGWVVRKIRQMPNCKNSIGVDGAKSMIQNAKEIDPGGEYFLEDLLKWSPKNKIDFVFSMEVFYYFKSPKTLTKHIVDKWLAPGGMLVIGLDHYIGNPDSYSWSEDLNVHMSLKDEEEWVQIFKSAGLSSCYSFKANASNDFPGTLCVVGQLKN